MGFQEKIQGLRKDRGLSQEEMAEAIGISRQAVAKWEAGSSYPDIDNLVALSDYFKVSIDSLIKNEDHCSKNTSTSKKSKSEDLVSFLCRAKKQTYAAHGAETTPSRPGSHDLIYKEGEWTYYDTYLGGEKFSGEEAVWRNDTPIYSMNYFGRVLDAEFNGDFLKEALFLTNEEYPYRGPLIYTAGDYSYHCTINGELEWYQGYEEIFAKGKKVFECYFHGGFVK